jgi:hypothetical protein
MHYPQVYYCINQLYEDAEDGPHVPVRPAEEYSRWSEWPPEASAYRVIRHYWADIDRLAVSGRGCFVLFLFVVFSVTSIT